MIFHAKALEVYAHTSHSLEILDVQKDLEVKNNKNMREK